MKCIVCNASFEMSEADRSKHGVHEPAYCSVGCFVNRNDGKKPTDDDMWNIHTGPVSKLAQVKTHLPLRPQRKPYANKRRISPYL